MAGADGFDVGDLILRGISRFIPSRKDSIPGNERKYREDAETFAMVKAVSKDELTADVTLGLDIAEVEGNLFKDVPIKLELGEGDKTGTPYGRVRYPQIGDIVCIKFFHNRLYRYIDRVVFFRAGNYTNKNIKDKILSLIDSVKDWLDYHISGTWFKVKENGDFESQLKGGITIKLEGKTFNLETDKYKIKADANSVDIEHGSNKIVLTDNNVELGNGTLRKIIDERIVAKHNSHLHTSAAPGSPTSTPTVPIVAAQVTTTKTKAS